MGGPVVDRCGVVVGGGGRGAVKGGVGAPMVWAGRVEKGGVPRVGPNPRRSGGSKGEGSKGEVGFEGWGSEG